ncbi:MAG: hypothetical protein R6U96_00870 [Promethearchaeia archaeon]
MEELEQKFEEMCDDLKEYEGVKEAFLLNNEGNVLFKSNNFELSNEESRAILQAWKDKKPALNYRNARYAVLKNDEIQLAAKNVSNGKGIAGSVTKDGNYLIIQTEQDSGMILLEWSIFVNKVAWT